MESLDCSFRDKYEDVSFLAFHSYDLSILFKATTKGVFLLDKSSNDSRVWFYRPCCKSMTRMAISQRLDPLDLRLLKLSWPGVSIIRSPGTLTSTGKKDLHFYT